MMEQATKRAKSRRAAKGGIVSLVAWLIGTLWIVLIYYSRDNTFVPSVSWNRSGMYLSAGLIFFLFIPVLFFDVLCQDAAWKSRFNALSLPKRLFYTFSTVPFSIFFFARFRLIWNRQGMYLGDGLAVALFILAIIAVLRQYPAGKFRPAISLIKLLVSTFSSGIILFFFAMLMWLAVSSTIMYILPDLITHFTGEDEHIRALMYASEPEDAQYQPVRRGRVCPSQISGEILGEDIFGFPQYLCVSLGFVPFFPSWHWVDVDLDIKRTALGMRIQSARIISHQP